VLREPGSGTRSHFEHAIAAHGVAAGALTVALELPSNEAVLSAAADGRMVAAASELAAGPFLAMGRLARLPLDLEARRFDLLVHKQRRLSAAGRAFVDGLPPMMAPA
jgi:DNA-binding transcriptional LysR family regulator